MECEFYFILVFRDVFNTMMIRGIIKLETQRCLKKRVNVNKYENKAVKWQSEIVLKFL